MLVALKNEEIAPEKIKKKGIQKMLRTGDKRIGLYINQYMDVTNKVGTDSDFIGELAVLIAERLLELK